MANTIKIKRSAVASKVPTTTDLELGELALNTYDGKLYTKKDNGTASIVELSGGAGATYTYSSSAPVSPAEGDEWLDSDTGILYTYVNDGNSSAWVELSSGGGWASNVDIPGTLDVTGITTLDSTVRIGVASTNANGGILQLSSGITFPETAVEATDVNTLDDYEEGNFTPTVIGTTTAGTATYVTQVARYTKIGNVVTIRIRVGWSAHTGTGNIRIGGLPFTTATDGAIAINPSDITSPANTIAKAEYVGSSTEIKLISVAIATNIKNDLAMDTVIGRIMLQGHYYI